MARLNQKEEELLLEVTNHLLKCVRYMSECYTLELDDLGKMDDLANTLYKSFGSRWIRENWYQDFEISKQQELELKSEEDEEFNKKFDEYTQH